MPRSTLILPLLLTLTACPKAPPTTAVVVASRADAEIPGPLAARPFTLPVPAVGTLSNGLSVVVVENHEVPLVYVRVVFATGSMHDPAGQEGLAQVTLDMMDEGAGEYDAAALSTAAKRLGSTVNTSAGLDGAQVSLRSLRERLPETLDLATTVLREPTFPESDWALMRDRRIQSLKASKKDPAKMADRAWRHLAYGDTYAGRLKSEAAYGTMTTAQMRTWWSTQLVPANAMIVVGGDTTLAEIQPLLEARLGDWVAAGPPTETIRPQQSALPDYDAGAIYLVDKPGAAQSVLRVGQFVGERDATDAAAFSLANEAIGGKFTARINMNLREDKGWTYGARSGTEFNHLPGLWKVGTNVVTDHTADSLREIYAELDASLTDRPITADELAASRGGILGTWPLSFEQPGYLLDRTVEVWRYDLPETWISGYTNRLQAVDLTQAQAAWQRYVSRDKQLTLVVGDAAVIRPGLEALGRPIIIIDADGKPTQ